MAGRLSRSTHRMAVFHCPSYFLGLFLTDIQALLKYRPLTSRLPHGPPEKQTVPPDPFWFSVPLRESVKV